MKAKVKKVKISIAENKDIAEMFNQMLGTGVANLSITYPRYLQIRNLCERILKVFTLLADSPLMVQPAFIDIRREIWNFCAGARDVLGPITACRDLSMYILNYDAVPEGLREQFVAEYNTLKRAPIMKTFISIADQLYPYRENFTEGRTAYQFIFNIPGIDWSPFPFDFNIKELMCMELPESSIEFIMLVISKAYEFSLALYEALRAPDVDIDQFIEIILSSITKLQTQSQLSRCGKAFAKIKESVMLLKTNFNAYYRDFIDTQDNAIIMEHFILDVSNNTKADPELTRQFREIISYYQKIAKQNPASNNEKLNAIFNTLSNEFKEFDVGLENLAKNKDGSESM